MTAEELTDFLHTAPKASLATIGQDGFPHQVLLKVTPEKVASWDHTKLGGRY
jgi:hypothetical protein